MEKREVGSRDRILAAGAHGLWEHNGYHIYGDPFREQHFDTG